MPALKNARHERYAQELAKGLSQADAYVQAGYRPSRSAAARLAADVNICERVAEIQGRAAVRAEITVADITDRLLKIADVAEISKDKQDHRSGDGSMSPKPTVIEFRSPGASDD
jgi:phage terminase small subunit